MRRLMNTKTGIPVNKGDTVTDFRGEPAIVKGWTPPKHSGSTGRVVVNEHGPDNTMYHEYYPSVYNLKFVEDAPTMSEYLLALQTVTGKRRRYHNTAWFALPGTGRTQFGRTNNGPYASHFHRKFTKRKAP